MTDFVSAPDGVRIAFEVVGEGEPVVLVHGFGASRDQNWREPGWYQTLTQAGYQVVALDCRGHGESDKPHDPAAYAGSIMSDDVLAVMRAARHKRANVMGYSMGAMLSLRLAHDHAQAVMRGILGGIGEVYFTRNDTWRKAIADGLVATDTSGLTPVQWMFRNFAREPGKDVEALAACMRASRPPLTFAELGAITTPMLVVAGGHDIVSGPPNALAEALGNGRHVTVENRDHMRTVGDKVYKQVVLDFLAA
jgi:pimeloyl-ACP methyl ester carboxylesterase